MTSQPKRILVVEDNVRDRNLLAAILESLGYDCELACDGAEALDKLDRSVDLVLLDVQMPGLDGFEVARRIRALPTYEDVPIIMVTVLTDREDRIRGVTVGANDFISKPIDRTELQVRVGSVLKMKEARDELRRVSEDLERKVEERTAALAHSEERYRALFESISNGVAIYRAVGDGEDFVIVDFNHAAEIITGRKREDVLDKSVRDVFPGVVSFGLFDVFKRVWKSGNPEHRPIGRYQDERIQIWADNSVCRLPSGEVVAVFCDETERKRAEDALKASEKKYRGLVETAPIGIMSVDAQGRILEVNPKLLEIMGSPSAADTKSINILAFKPLVDTGISEVVLRCIDGATAQIYETPYMSKWGKQSYLRVLLTPLFDDSGRIKGCQAVVEDVTERKEAERELRESRRMFETIVGTVPVGINLARDRKIQWANDAWVKIFGFEDESQYLGKSARIIYPTAKEFYEAGDFLYKDLESGVVRELDTRLTRRDGTIFDAILRAAALDPSNLSAGIIAAISDVSERKRAQEALQESERRYRTIFDNAAVGMALVDRHGRFLEVNECLAGFLGRTQEELKDLGIPTITHSEDVSKSMERHFAIVRGEVDGYRLEKRYVRKDGAVVWADLSVSALRNADGQFRAGVGIIADITARKRSDEVRRLLATAVEQAAEAILMVDISGTLTYVNPAFERSTGYSREEAIGMNVRELTSDVHDDDFFRHVWRTAIGGKVWSGHLTSVRKDGTSFEEEATVSPIKDGSGKIVSFVAVKRDVTKEMSLQSQLVQAQKMEAVGTLAGGIAHDFNNLLQVTLGYSELLLAEREKKDSEYSDLMKIFQAAKSGAELVRRLLTFSRQVDPKPVPLDLNREIVQVEELLRRTIPRMIDIRLELADDVARINADPTQVEQVLMNLAVNACDAMPEGGTLTIVTTRSVLDEEFCETHVGARQGEYVLLTVSDTGHGMDRSIVERIFEPFFSTKELGRGTGLGLPMVYGIVKQHQGYILCRSRPGEGTTFEVYWPAIGSVAESRTDDIAIAPAGGHETILLVDDEQFIRDLAVKILSRAGYKVLTAENGREGLNLFAKERERIALVILDLNMPIMGGKDCLKGLQNIDPRVKALVASGYSSGVIKFQAEELGAKGFVRKPFRVRQLLRQIRQVLDEDSCDRHGADETRSG